MVQTSTNGFVSVFGERKWYCEGSEEENLKRRSQVRDLPAPSVPDAEAGGAPEERGGAWLTGEGISLHAEGGLR